MKKRCFLIMVTLMFLGFSARPVDAAYQFETTAEFDAFDSVIRVNIRHRESLDELLVEGFFDDADEILNDIHRLATSHEAFDDLKNVHFLNQKKNQGQFHEVDERLIEMITVGIDYHNHPLGGERFNIALGRVLEIWNDHDRQCNFYGNCEVPDVADLAAAGETADPNLIEIDAEHHRVKLPEGLKLDLGAIAKGYGARLVGAYLRTTGVDAFTVNAGMSNIEFYGKPEPDRDFWIGALINPFRNEAGQYEHYARIEVASGQNIVTSGDYVRAFTVDGVDYHHIIDPKTWFPSHHIRTVSIVSDDPMLGDIYSTIAFILPLDEAIAFIDALDDVEAIWVDRDGDVHFSERFEDVHLLDLRTPSDKMGEQGLENGVESDGADPIIVALFALLGVIVVAFGITLLIEHRKKVRDDTGDAEDSTPPETSP